MRKRGYEIMFSKQLIADITKKLHTEIITFCNMQQELQLNLLIEQVLDTYYSETMTQADVHSLYLRITKQNRTKKSRWYASYLADKKNFSIESPKNPFHSIYLQNKSLLLPQWQMLYGSKTIADVQKDLELQVTEWNKDSNSLLISFPFIMSKTLLRIHQALESDIALDIGRILKEYYGGTMKNFFRSYPEELIERPLFSPIGFNLPLTKTPEELFEDFFPTEDTEIFIRTQLESKEQKNHKVADSKDLEILNFMIANIDNTFYETRTVILDLADIAKVLYPRPGGKHYSSVAKRCLKLSRYNYTYYDKNNISGQSINFFDSVKIEPTGNGKRVVLIRFGDILYNSIVSKKMISVTSDNYLSLENELSKILCYTFQNERIRLYSKFFDLKTSSLPEYLSKDYSLSFFQLRVRFRTKQRKQCLKLIEESLEEFKQNHIAIKNYEFNGELFHITYYPLSLDEIADLKFNK